MGQVLQRERHHDGGSPSCDTAWSREPEGAGQALRGKPEDCCEVAQAGGGDGPAHRRREPKSTVLTVEDEAIIVAFRRHTLLPLAIALIHCKRRSRI